MADEKILSEILMELQNLKNMLEPKLCTKCKGEGKCYASSWAFQCEYCGGWGYIAYPRTAKKLEEMK